MLNRFKAAALATAMASFAFATPSEVGAKPSSIVGGVGIVAADARVNGTTIHYLRAGQGSTALILIHGWPQSSHEWHKVIPELAKTFTVIAVDLRGIGGSQSTASGYDKANMAEDIHQLVRSLGLQRIYVAGHDIGGQVAYAYLRTHAEDLAGVAIMDVPVPAIDPWDALKKDPRSWHFSFHQEPGLGEALVQGRQSVYFRSFYDRLAAKPGAITNDELAVFAKAYAGVDHLKSGFEFYRAFPQDEAFNKAHAGPLPVPVLLVGAEKSLGPMLPTFAQSLTQMGGAQVRTVVIPGSGHWIAEENPAAVIAALRNFIEQTRDGSR